MLTRVLPWASLCALSVSLALAAGCSSAAGAGDAGAGPTPRVDGTTLTRSLIPTPGGPLPGQGSWVELSEADGFPMLTRTELTGVRSASRRGLPLASFAHLTDMHIVDAGSPTRAVMLAAFLEENENFADAIRPQEPLTTHVLEAMVRRLNSVGRGPVTGQAFTAVVSTGDNGDSKLRTELENYIALLNGGTVHPAPGGTYVGMQDTWSEAGAEVYARFYHPDPPPAGMPRDQWKEKLGFREFPGLLQSAAASFQATGLAFPWFAGNGNHDVAYLGDLDVSPPSFRAAMDAYASGTQLVLDPAANLPAPGNQYPDNVGFALTAFGAQDPAMLQQLVASSRNRTVPAVAHRTFYTPQDFCDAHQAPGRMGPAGHGLTAANRESGVMDFQFDLTAPGSLRRVVGLMLDTNNPSAAQPWTLQEMQQDPQGVLAGLSLSSDGSVGAQQLARLEARLRAVHSVYYDESGRPVPTGNPDSLVVVFSHHNSWTMRNTAARPEVPGADGPRIDGDALVRLLLRYPNVVGWVNGHSHFHRIVPHPGDHGGFWEINTASHLDFPQQSRTVELVDNGDGTLSFYAVVLDHVGPAAPARTEGPFGLLDLASLGRLLALNNSYVPGIPRMGEPTDRNVELLVPDPARRR